MVWVFQRTFQLVKLEALLEASKLTISFLKGLLVALLNRVIPTNFGENERVRLFIVRLNKCVSRNQVTRDKLIA